MNPYTIAAMALLGHGIGNQQAEADRDYNLSQAVLTKNAYLTGAMGKPRETANPTKYMLQGAVGGAGLGSSLAKADSETKRNLAMAKAAGGSKKSPYMILDSEGRDSLGVLHPEWAD